jgi:hypothetical protein
MVQTRAKRRMLADRTILKQHGTGKHTSKKKETDDAALKAFELEPARH